VMGAVASGQCLRFAEEDASPRLRVFDAKTGCMAGLVKLLQPGPTGCRHIELEGLEDPPGVSAGSKTLLVAQAAVKVIRKAKLVVLGCSVVGPSSTQIAAAATLQLATNTAAVNRSTTAAAEGCSSPETEDLSAAWWPPMTFGTEGEPRFERASGSVVPRSLQAPGGAPQGSFEADARDLLKRFRDIAAACSMVTEGATQQ
ncbi:unnamed protein product, partial [Polarella glacialis]